MVLAAAVFLIIQNLIAPAPAGASSTPGPGTTWRPVLATLGDSITFGVGASDAKKTSYAAIFAADLGANWTNLGISGETSSRSPTPFFLGTLPAAPHIRKWTAYSQTRCRAFL